MKEVTSVKYECADGTRFEDKGKAMKHEFRLVADEEIEGDRMTAAGIIDAMFDNPGPYINMLTEAHVEKLAEEEVPEAAE